MDSDDTPVTSETETEQSVRELPQSRRSVLALGATGLATSLAGCVPIGNENPTATGPSGSSVFTDISFEGQQMAVGLAEGHSVERLNLIAPDGSEFSNQRVAEGETTLRITLMDIKAGLSGYEHYHPGKYKLVAEDDVGDSTTRQLKLEPKIDISGFSPRSNPSTDIVDTVEVELYNEGSGPTWIYDIAFQGLGKGEVSSIGDIPGIPSSYLRKPDNPTSTVLRPGEKQTFISRNQPFIFDTDSLCTNQELVGTVIAGTPTEVNGRRKFQINFSGKAKSTDPSTGREEYGCTTASIKPNN